MSLRFSGRLLLLASSLFLMRSAVAGPLGSAFNYQGRLLESGFPANGRYEMQFALFAAQIGGSPTVPMLTNAEVIVSNGLFSSTLDFGPSAFLGASCWLEIGVRPAGQPGGFAVLSPRQLLTPAPYAIYTLKAESLT